jgi:hypothetical protein
MSLIAYDESVLKEADRFAEDKLCQFCLFDADDKALGDAKAIVELSKGLTGSLGKDSEDFHNMSPDSKRFFHQRLCFLLQMMAHGLVNKDSVSRTKAAAMKVASELIRFELDCSGETPVGRVDCTQRDDFKQSLSVSLNLRIMKRCLQIVRTAEQLSVFYKKNAMLVELRQAVSRKVNFGQRLSNALFRKDSADAPRLSKDGPNGRQSDAVSVCSSERVADDGEANESGRKASDRKSDVVVKLKQDKPFKGMFLILGYYFVRLKEQLVRLIERSRDSGIMQSLKKTEALISDCRDTAIDSHTRKMKVTNQLSRFFKAFKLQRKVRECKSLQPVSSTVSPLPELSMPQILSELNQGSFDQLEQFVGWHLARLKESFGSKLRFKQDQVALAAHNFIEVITFMSSQADSACVPPSLMSDYLVLCNFFVFLNIKNVTAVHPFLSHFLRHPQHKSSLNVVMQMTHFTNKLSLLESIAEATVAKLLEVEKSFLKKSGFAKDTQPQSDLTAPKAHRPNPFCDQVDNLVELLVCLVNESNHHRERISNVLFDRLKNSDTFRQVYLFELFSQSDLVDFQPVFLSQDGLKVSCSLLLLISRLIASSPSVAEFYKKTCSGKQMELLIDCAEKDVSTRARLLDIYHQLFVARRTTDFSNALDLFVVELLVKVVGSFTGELKAAAKTVSALSRKDKQHSQSSKAAKQRLTVLMGVLFQPLFSQVNGLLVLVHSVVVPMWNMRNSGRTEVPERRPEVESFMEAKRKEGVVRLQGHVASILDVYQSVIDSKHSFNDLWKFQFVSFGCAIAETLSGLLRGPAALKRSPTGTKLAERALDDKQYLDDEEKLLLLSSPPKNDDFFEEFCLRVSTHMRTTCYNLEFALIELFLNEDMSFEDKLLYLHQRVFADDSDVALQSVLSRFSQTEFYKTHCNTESRNHLFLLFSNELVSTVARLTCHNHHFDLSSKLPLHKDCVEELRSKAADQLHSDRFGRVKGRLRLNPRKAEFLSMLQDEFLENTSAGRNRFNEVFADFHWSNKVKGTCDEPRGHLQFFLWAVLEIYSQIARVAKEECKAADASPGSHFDPAVTDIVCHYLRVAEDFKVRFLSLQILILVMKSSAGLPKDSLDRKLMADRFRHNLGPTLAAVVRATLQEFTDSVLSKSDANFELIDFTFFRKNKGLKAANRVKVVLNFLSNYLTAIEQGEDSAEAGSRAAKALPTETVLLLASFFFKFMSGLSKNYSLLRLTEPQMWTQIEKVVQKAHQLVAQMCDMGLVPAQNLKDIVRFVLGVFDRLDTPTAVRVSGDGLKAFYLFLLVRLLRFLVVQAQQWQPVFVAYLQTQDFSKMLSFSQTVFEESVLPKKALFLDEEFCSLVYANRKATHCTPTACHEGKVSRSEFFLNEIAFLTFFIFRSLMKGDVLERVTNGQGLPGNPAVGQSCFCHFLQLETSVEVFLNGKTTKLLFKKPKLADQVSAEILDKFGKQLLTAVSVYDYAAVFGSMHSVIQKMFRSAYLGRTWLPRLYKRHLKAIGWVTYALTVAINAIVLFTLRQKEGSLKSNADDFKLTTLRSTVPGFLVVYYLLAVIVLSAALLQLGMRVYFNYVRGIVFEKKAALATEVEDKALGNSAVASPSHANDTNGFFGRLKLFLRTSVVLRNCVSFWSNFTFYYLLFLVCAVLGLTDPFWWSLLLLDVVRQAASVKRFFRALAKNGVSLLSMLLIGLALTYVYACSYFLILQDSLGAIDPEKRSAFRSLLSTFLASIYYGTRTQGGLGAYIENWAVGTKDYLARFVVDLLFFFCFNVLCLSFLGALVMESYFLFKRNLLNKQLEQNKEYCFICHQSIVQLKNSGEDWNVHLEERHSLKNYFHFFVYLHLNQDLYQFGNSKVIKEMVSHKDFSFMPVFKGKSK